MILYYIMILHSHTRIPILFTFSGPTNVLKCVKFACYGFFVVGINLFVRGLKHYCIELPVVIMSIFL